MKAHNTKTPSANGGEEAPPEWGGVRLGPRVVGLLYGLLFGAFALALWGREYPGALPARVEQIAPWVFLVFVGVFAFYRLGLARAGKYPVYKAFFQIAAAVLIFTLLLPGVRARHVDPVDDVMALMHHRDARVRAMAAEVAPLRPESGRYAPHLVAALEDRAPRVREQAHRSLVRIAGQDFGAPTSAEAVKAWKERFP
ncbi:MAG: hypothetical protein ACKVPX_01720 [Myxococcaceae bacterium]